MGVVYRALDPALNRYVAVKVMTQGIATDPELRDRFMREARAAGSLQHPNIITIYDFGETEGGLYIAMEYVEGSDLSEVMGRKDPLPLAGKLDIVVDVLQALDYAHNRRVVHRDVKPGNVRVGVDGRAKLMDFGIARLEKSDLTKSGIMIGTPDYMAPEQITGGEITPATDVFATGVVLYEFLSGRRPFDGETLHAVLYKVVHEQPPPLKDIAPDVPLSLQPIVWRALAKDPGARYPSAGAMARDLTAVRMALSGAKTVAIRSRVTPLRTLRVEQPARRRRRLLLGTGAGALVLVAAAGFLVWSGRLHLPVGALRKPAPAETLAAVSPSSVPAPAVGGQPVGETTAAGRQPPAAADTAAAPAPVDAQAASQRRPAARPGREEPAPSRRRLAPSDAAASAQGSGLPPAQQVAQTQAQVPAPQQAPAQTPVTPTPQAAAPAAAQPAASQPAPSRPAAPPAAEPAAPPPDPRPEIEDLVAAYAQAIENKSIDDMRRVYPGLPADKEKGWRVFFRAVRGSVRAQLALAQLDVRGATADLVVRGTYEYDDAGGSHREDKNFRASAALQGGVWKLTLVP
jgi:serine/threonine-protein kinase